MKKLYGLIIIALNFNFLHAQTADEFYETGMAKAKVNDYKGAIVDFTKALEINPKDEFAYFNRGLSKYYLGDFTTSYSAKKTRW